MKILQTKEYGKFQASDHNRAVTRNKQLHDSMERYGWLSAYPMHVKKNCVGYVILDGQHRFQTATELGLPVKYVVDNNEDVSIAEINNAQRRWTNGDYLSSYCQQGLSDYLYLQAFTDRHHLPISISMQLLRGTASHNGRDAISAFRSGQFKVKDTETAEHIAVMVSFAKKFIPFATNAEFVGALFRCSQVNGWDNQRFMKKAASHGPIVERRATIADFVSEIEKLYNRQARASDIVPLAVYIK